MPGRQIRVAVAKVHRSYTVDEAATLYECHYNTVHNWVREGLKPIDDRYPIMFHGTTLNDFHKRRRASSKRPCRLGEIYCVVCREPKKPAGDMVDYVPGRGLGGTVTAICPDCGGLLRQAVGPDRLAAFRQQCSVSVRTMENVLEEPSRPAATVKASNEVSK